MGLPGISWGFIWDLVGFICDCSVTFMQQLANDFFFTFFLDLNFRPGRFQMSTAVAKSPKGVFLFEFLLADSHWRTLRSWIFERLHQYIDYVWLMNIIKSHQAE
jgi:hypothetical protein